MQKKTVGCPSVFSISLDPSQNVDTLAQSEVVPTDVIRLLLMHQRWLVIRNSLRKNKKIKLSKPSFSYHNSIILGSLGQF